MIFFFINSYKIYMNKKIVAIILFIVCMFIFDYIDDVLDNDDNEKFTIEEIQKNSELCFKKKKKQNIGTCIKSKGPCYHKNNTYYSSPIIPCVTTKIYNNNFKEQYQKKVSTIIDTQTFDGNMFYTIHTPFLVNGRNSDKPRSCT